MRLIAVGVNHRTAPVALRESLDFRRAGLDAALEALSRRELVREAVIVSTCNRVELYAAVDSDTVADACARFLADYHGVAWETLAPHLFVLRGADAARHLFRVAAGLDSLVVGEPQILGQVKEAFAASERARRTGALIGRAFTTAFTAGKRVRTRDRPRRRGAVSVSYAAVALAKKILGTLEGRDVLILGAGEMAELTAVHLRDQAARRVTVTSRTLATAAALADRLGGRAVAWDQMPQALREADVVVCATGASEPVLTRRAVEAAMRSRRGRPLFLVDIAVPRDVDADAGAVDQVFLYNIDDLQAIVAESLAKRAGELAHAERIVAEELDRFAAWMQSRKVVPTVVALRQRFDAIRQAELRRLEPRLAALPPDARARVDEITHLIVEKLLLAPTEQLKSAGDDDTLVSYADAVARLFELSSDARGDEASARAAARAGESRVVTPLRIGTRGSALALWQARTVADRLALGGRDGGAGRDPHRGRSPAGSAAVRGRRQAPLRQGNRGRAAVGARRRRRPQREGHAVRRSRVARRGRRAAARGSARRARPAVRRRDPVVRRRRRAAARRARDRHRQHPAARPASRARAGRPLPSAARQRRYPAAQARRRRVRRHRPGRRRAETPGEWRARVGR